MWVRKTGNEDCEYFGLESYCCIASLPHFTEGGDSFGNLTFDFTYNIHIDKLF